MWPAVCRVWGVAPDRGNPIMRENLIPTPPTRSPARYVPPTLPADFEFIAAYVIPYDAWYIVPMSFIAAANASSFTLTISRAAVSRKSSVKPGTC